MFGLATSIESGHKNNKRTVRDTSHVDNEVYLSIRNKQIELLFIPLISCHIDFIFLFCPADNELFAGIQKENAKKCNACVTTTQ